MVFKALSSDTKRLHLCGILQVAVIIIIFFVLYLTWPDFWKIPKIHRDLIISTLGFAAGMEIVIILNVAYYFVLHRKRV